MIKRLLLYIFIIVIISGCAKENKEISLSNSVNTELEQGYLYKDSISCLFFDLESKKAYQVKISPYDVKSYDLTYTIDNKNISIRLSNNTFTGTIENDYISLKTMNTDGTISYQRFNKATINDYNKTIITLKYSQSDIDNINTLNQIKDQINDNMSKLKKTINNIKSYKFDLSEIENAYNKAYEKYNIWLNTKVDKDLKKGNLEVSIGTVEVKFTDIEVKFKSLNDDIKYSYSLIDDIKAYLESYKLTSGNEFQNKSMLNNYSNYIKTCKSYKDKNKKYMDSAKKIMNKAYKLK